MSHEQYEKIVDALSYFVVRVASGETATEKESEALPAVVSSLAQLIQAWSNLN